MKKIIIIGGGISGLAAGIYAQQYGFQSEIYEKNSIPGGQCIGWNRKGYHIDGCIHWLTGTKEGTDMHKTWVNCGALGNGIKVYSPDNFGRYEFKEGTITLWTDLNRLKKELIELSPEDEKIINVFISEIETCSASEGLPSEKPFNLMKVMDYMALGKKMKNMGLIMKKYKKFSCEDYAKLFKHAALQKLFNTVMLPNYSITAFFFSFATVISGNGGFPESGSLAMSKRMEERYKSLGGQIHYNSSVKEIIIEDHTALGITLENGNKILGDYVIPSSDINFTLTKLLKGNYTIKEFNERFSDSKKYNIPTCVLCSYAVKADFTGFPNGITWDIDNPLHVGDTDLYGIGIKEYSKIANLNTEEGTVIEVYLGQSDNDYEVWAELYKDKKKYNEEKERLSKEIVKLLLERFPEFEGNITPLDVATPATYERYMNAYHGSYMSFNMTPQSKQIMHSGIIKGLKNLVLAGQWLMTPGGLPSAAIMGKFAVMNICDMEKIPLDINN